MKTCTKCKQSKELTEFSKKKNSYHAWCKACVKTYDASRYKSNPKAIKDRNKRTQFNVIKWLQQYKSNTPCKDCNQKYPYYIMEFDHLPEYEKEFTISVLARQGRKKVLLAEMTKCELVCANCHRIRTQERKYGLMAEAVNASD